MIVESDSSILDWTKGNGLLPAIVQDAENGRVLMLGYMNEDALRATLSSGFVTFYSRSRNTLWRKGETSQNTLRLCAIVADCDKDALLVTALPQGPTCHTGAQSCFAGEAGLFAILPNLQATIKQRMACPQEDSYTNQLLASGLQRIAQKVGEEGVETALAAVSTPESLAGEAADLLYHLIVLLNAAGLSLQDALNVLQERAR